MICDWTPGEEAVVLLYNVEFEDTKAMLHDVAGCDRSDRDIKAKMQELHALVSAAA